MRKTIASANSHISYNFQHFITSVKLSDNITTKLDIYVIYCTTMPTTDIIFYQKLNSNFQIKNMVAITKKEICNSI